MENVKTKIAALAIIGALGGGMYEGLVSDGPQDTPLSNEIVGLRTGNIVSFRLPDGKINAHVFQQPIHYKDNRGEWKQIDTTLKPKPFILRALSSRPYEVTSGIYIAEFPDTAEYNYKFSNNGASVEYEAKFGITKSVSINVAITKTGIKETVTLLDSKAPAKLEWDLIVEGIVRDESGGFGVYNTDGGLGFLIQAADARDRTGRELNVKTTIDKSIMTAEIDTMGAIYPIIVDPSTTIAGVMAKTGSVYVTDAVYLTARNDADGETTHDTRLYVGQSAAYIVYRNVICFPGIPNMDVAANCTLYADGYTDVSTTDFNLYILGATSYKSTFEAGDFVNFNGWAASGAYTGTVLNDAWNSSSYSADWNAITFNAAGLDSIEAAKTDTLWIAMVSEEDYNASVPANDEYVAFIETGGLGDAYLSITYGFTYPTNFTSTDSTSTAVFCEWDDNAWDETGYRIKNIDTSTYIDSTSADATSKLVSGLSVNTKYRLAVEVKGGTFDGNLSNTDSCYTRANTPGAPTVTHPANDSTKVVIAVNGNPAYTLFNIMFITSTPETLYMDYSATPDTLRTGVHSISLSDTTWAWRTYAGWGGASGTTVKTQVGRQYAVKVEAISGE